MDDFSGLEYAHDSLVDNDVISKANNLLSQFNLPTKVTELQDITAALFVVLYESLFSDRLPGIVRQPVTREDEIHNCQIVIDVLAADVIKDSLSHIRGIDIVEGKVQAISNLIDIFIFLFEYVIKQIESDAPTDTEDDQAKEEAPLQALDVLSKENSETKHNDGNGAKVIKSTDDNRDDNSWSISSEVDGSKKTSGFRAQGKERGYRTTAPAKVIYTTAPSPIHPDGASSLLEQETINSTQELIQEGEKVQLNLQKNQQPEVKVTWEDPRKDGVADGQFDFIGRRPACFNSGGQPNKCHVPRSNSRNHGSRHYTFTHHLIYHYPQDIMASSITAAVVGTCLPLKPSAAGANFHSGSSIPSSAYQHFSENELNMSVSMPVPKRPVTPQQQDKLRTTIGPISYHNWMTPEKPYHQREEEQGEGIPSYGDLHQLVQRTAALTQAAIDRSPLRMNSKRSTPGITDISAQGCQVPPSEAMKLAHELNKFHLDPPCHLPQQQGDIDGVAADKVLSREMLSDQQQKSAVKSSRRSVKMRSQREETEHEKHKIKTKADIFTVKTTQKWDKDSKESEKLKSEQRGVSSGRSHTNDSESDNPYSPTRKQRHHDIVDDVLSCDSDELVAALREQARGQIKKRLLFQKLDRMGDESLFDIHCHLDTEKDIARKKQNILEKMYEEEYEDIAEEVERRLKEESKFLSKLEEEYKKMLMARKKPKKTKSSTKPKGYLTAAAPKKLKISFQSKSSNSNAKCQTDNTDVRAPAAAGRLLISDEDDLMPLLMKEFPHLYISDHTWHELWRKGISQIEGLTRSYEENKRRKSKVQKQLEEAAQKHEVLAQAIKKQMEHSKRLHDIQNQKAQQTLMKNKVHEKRLQSARTRRYYNDYQVRTRSKMLKRRTKEEAIFKNLFKDGLSIQKERILEMRRYAKDQREKQDQRRQDEIDSLENYYRDQFDMLVQKVINERQETFIREKAQKKVLDDMKRDLRRRMETEIGEIQSQLFRDDDDAYFRQLDADCLRHGLQIAKYQTRV
ncbi:centrosomal protein of 95 kDa-like isoform X3 [Pomacea canaliculata]|uniref:centrosomal protein of 95 kDa-like isoform X3 n=1 Tax=Pomacea canaliculata TaxID=400727 RepID=UPI000D72DDF2|nr:centrosomal protein of 95 kDa-like isoform X3 [Pomacea canaliculata]